MGRSIRKKNLSSTKKVFGGKYQKVLNLVLIDNVDNNRTNLIMKISEDAILRFLLSEDTLKVITKLEDEIKLSVDEKQKRAETLKMLEILKKNINKEDKLTEVEFYKSKIMGSIPDLLGKVHHKFVVFKTTGSKGEHYWWSVEKNTKHIVIQRCGGNGAKVAVKNKLEGTNRKVKKYSEKQYDGKGTIYDLLQYAVVYGIIGEPYHLFKSNCQQLVEFLSAKITAEEQKICGAIPYIPPPIEFKEVGKNNYLIDVFNFPDWSPITAIVYMDNIQLLKKALDNGKYDIDTFFNGITPLNLAIFFSRTKMVEYLLNTMNADPTKCDKDGKSPIQMAAMFSRKGPEIIQLLLNTGKVDVNHQDKKWGYTALHYAVVSSNNKSTTKLLLEKGADPTLYNSNKDTALHLAALEDNNTKTIDLLLENEKVDINQCGQDEMTPLHYAVSQSNLQSVRHLLVKGANSTSRDNDGISPLDMAASSGIDVKLIDLLLDIGKVKIKDKDKESGQTALHCAVSKSNALTARHLIKRGADLKAVDENGYTPFYLAASDAKNTEILQVFLKKVDVNIPDQETKNTALHYAVRNSNVLSTRYLLKKGADPTLVNNNKQNALHVAAAFAENTEIIDLLLTEKMDINQATPDGMAPLHYAVFEYNLQSIRHLLDKGANPEARDNYDRLPLDIAESLFSGNEEIINLLRLKSQC